MSLAAALQPVAERPLALRRRADLEFSAQHAGYERYWVVKDPVALAYFQLRDEEHEVLMQLDGRASLESIRAHCCRKFAPRVVTHSQLHSFLATLHRHGLLLGGAPGQSTQLFARSGEIRRRKLFQTVLGGLALRFRGIDPHWLIDRLYPWGRWLFSRSAVAITLLAALCAALLVAVQFDAFRARLPEFQAIVSASNIPWLVVVLIATKIAHELGHALACRHFGGNCHEIGVMMLVFVPCLYCNVTDSWMFRSKWQRMAVAAAGIYVELILATAATFLWWASAPGLFNALCLNTMIVCSVGTLMFNGNPLLRYDGYYILSDLVEIPNLGEQSSAVVRRLAARWCLGVALPEDRPSSGGRQLLLAAYAIASGIYRWIVVIAILWGLRQMARPYHAEPLVAALAALVITGMALPMVLATAKVFRTGATPRRLAPLRVALSGGLLIAGVLAVALVPLPMRVNAPLVIENRDAARVYVTVPGVLKKSLPNGTIVDAGEVIAELAAPTLELELAKLRSQLDRQQIYVQNLKSQKLQGTIDGAEIPAAESALVDLQQRVEQLTRDLAQLTIVSPSKGTLLPAPHRPRLDSDRTTLETWNGTPLDRQNVGAFLETGTVVCLVGDPKQHEAVLHVEQTDIDLVQIGQSARMVLDHMPDTVLDGKVVEISQLDMKVMPRELTQARDVPSRTDDRGISRPLDTWYQVRVVFDEQPPQLVARVHGQAKIAVAPETLAARLSRWLKQTFSR